MSVTLGRTTADIKVTPCSVLGQSLTSTINSTVIIEPPGFSHGSFFNVGVMVSIIQQDLDF